MRRTRTLTLAYVSYAFKTSFSRFLLDFETGVSRLRVWRCSTCSVLELAPGNTSKFQVSCCCKYQQTWAESSFHHVRGECRQDPVLKMWDVLSLWKFGEHRVGKYFKIRHQPCEMEGKAGKGAFGSPPLCKCVFKTNYNAAIRQSICSRTRLLTPASWVRLSWACLILGNEGTVVCRRLLMEERISFKKDIFYFPIGFFS